MEPKGEMAEIDPTQAIAEFIELMNSEKEIKAELKALGKIKSDLQEIILKHFERNGIQNIKQNGATVYLKRDLWAGREEGVTNEEAAQALQDAGLGEYVGPSTQGLSAYLRELDELGEQIPAPLRGKIKVTETFKIQSRRS
jgi:hypothetical protein|tara:strand:- start:1606 stop:2028 length:423 start_codon:yes stop_codon:yes gene_type:complete